MNEKNPLEPMARLIAIMKRLRSPGGCPWDRLQSPETLKPYVLEEAYEVVAAIEAGDAPEIRDELGDLLLQVVFLADIYADRGRFDFDDIAEAICGKLVRRHPHVFGDGNENDLERLDRQWASIKKAERDGPELSLLDGLPTNLPALLRAHKVSSRVARVGFDWECIDDILRQLEDELSELRQAMADGDTAAIGHEIGDVLFTVVNIGRYFTLDCESALHEMIGRFDRRFRIMEDLIDRDGRSLERMSSDDMNDYWRAAKRIDGAAIKSRPKS